MASFLLLSDVPLSVGEYTEEGIKAEEGASNKEQGESAEPEKEISASANDAEVPMEVGIGILLCLMQSLLRDDSPHVLTISVTVLCIFAFQTDLTVLFAYTVLFHCSLICPQQCAQPAEAAPQEAKSPVNSTEADEKKEEPEVKERTDEPMEVESKGISGEVV